MKSGRLKRFVILLTVAAILLAVASPISGYDGEPTDDELAGWWEDLERSERLAELRTLDRLDNAPAQIDAPNLVVVQTEDGTIHAYADGPLSISIDGIRTEVITLPEVTVDGNPKRDVWKWFGAGAGLGALGAALLFLLAP